MTDRLEVEEIDFAGLSIRFDDRVLRPRPWTACQSTWGAALLAHLPPGPVLELCCGAGHLGLAAVLESDRTLVCVDRDAAAVSYAALNARTAGLADRVEVRRGDLRRVVGPDERYALVLADPPWVPTTETDRWPEDPRGAIDGGADGLAVAAACLEVAASRLLAGGAILVQLGSRTQAQVLAAQAARLGVSLGEVRSGERGVVARFAGTLDEPPDRAPG